MKPAALSSHSFDDVAAVRGGRSSKEGVLTERLATGEHPIRGKAPGALPVDESREILSLALDSLDQDKAEDVVSIDLQGKSSVADHMVVASGRSSRQVAAMAQKLAERFKARFGHAPKIEGLTAGDWVLLDCGDVIVHLFRPEVRDFYQLEKMWMSPADAGPRMTGAA